MIVFLAVIIGLLSGGMAVWLLTTRADKLEVGPNVARVVVCLLMAYVAFTVWQSPVPNIVPAFESANVVLVTYVLVGLGIFIGLFLAIRGLWQNFRTDVAALRASVSVTGGILICTAAFAYIFLGLTSKW